MKNVFALIICALFASATAMAANNDRLNPDYDRTMSDQHQAADAFLGAAPTRGLSADKLMGKSVKNRATNDEIGSVEDLILDRDGQLVAVVISVGGFLGIGEKDVAVAWDRISVSHDRDDDELVLHVDATEDQLKNAPEYDRS